MIKHKWLHILRILRKNQNIIENIEQRKLYPHLKAKKSHLQALPIPPRPPAKRQRLCNESEHESTSTTDFCDSTKRHNDLQNISSCSHSFLQDAPSNHSACYERDEETWNIVEIRTQKNRENLLNWSALRMSKIERLNCTQESLQRENENENLNNQFSYSAIVDHLKRLTRDIATIKYDIRQNLTLLDILVKANAKMEAQNTTFPFEDAGIYFHYKLYSN
ncbi:uncharacterized protein LOC112589724 [Harpegnathos saltator]|uniref:uncharacterized protein LOC112589724 n=1 Tax=Harpegnathos saltator TaxID=610380 RepID=UPI000DBEF03E|nr:uncharacterized protein LOC112589724 [Harpegnathos saltator]